MNLGALKHRPQDRPAPVDAPPEAASPATDELREATRASRGTLAAYLVLTKPRIALLVLLTTAVGFWLGGRGVVALWPLAVSLAGTAFVAAGSSVWNQVIERVRDGRMRRTMRRPLPTGELAPLPAGIFGGVLVVGGAALLYAVQPLAALVALVTFVLYVAVYTPLKPWTTLNTAIGAVPGALPPVIGWAAATGDVSLPAWSLFLIVFLWQFPHFLSIAWIYRDDYARGGHRMLPVIDRDGYYTGAQATAYALTLIPVGLFPAILGLAGPIYLAGSLVLGVHYAYHAAAFWWTVSDRNARRLMRASFLYLPAMFLLLVLNTIRG